jgi:RNA polymerase sigma-70 factor (ECF subfamily)
VVLVVGDRVFAVISLEVTTEGITAVHTQANPAKLDRATRHWAGGEPLVEGW